MKNNIAKNNIIEFEYSTSNHKIQSNRHLSLPVKNYPNRKFKLRLGLSSALLLSTFWLISCDQASKEEYYEDNSSEEQSISAESVDSAVIDMPRNGENLQVENLSRDSKAQLGSLTASTDIAGKELLISVNADFKVDDVVKSSHAIESLTRQQGGYIETSNISSREIHETTYAKGDKEIKLITYYRQADMVVRVPKQKVNNFLHQVQSQVKFLNHQEFKAEDVYLDLQREKLKAELNKEMASELNNQRLNSSNEKEQSSNIDSIKETYSARQRQQYAELGRMVIADKVKFSTIRFTFTQPNSVYKEITDNLESLVAIEQPNFWERVKTSLINGWDTIKEVILWLISLWWLVVLGLLFYVIYRIIKPLITAYSSNRIKKRRQKD